MLVSGHRCGGRVAGHWQCRDGRALAVDVLSAERFPMYSFIAALCWSVLVTMVEHSKLVHTSSYVRYVTVPLLAGLQAARECHPQRETTASVAQSRVKDWHA